MRIARWTIFKHILNGGVKVKIRHKIGFLYTPKGVINIFPANGIFKLMGKFRYKCSV